jgi:hypothetical protein
MGRSQKTETEQLQFFEACLQRFILAAGRTGEVKRFYNLAGTVVCLNFAGNAMLPWLTPALEHLRAKEVTDPAATIHVWDAMSTGVEMVPPPCAGADFTDRGDIWGFNSKRIKTAFHWSEYSVNVMDMETGTGVYWVKNPYAFPYWVFSSPFRTQFHWLMESKGCQLLHAAAVGTAGGAVLIPGKGGAGKSNTALTCLEKGFYYLGDDYVIVRKDPVPVVFSLYSTAKVNFEDLPGFPSMKVHVQKPIREGQEKAVMFLQPGFGDRIVSEMPLKAILTPKIEKQEQTSIRAVSFWPVMQAMSFTTMSQLPGVGAHTHEYLSEFTSRLPCFSLVLGSDREDVARSVAGVIANPGQSGQEMNIPAAGQQDPLITVIIPVYNSEQFIGEAVNNVLSQNYPAIELIIVDDGSTDRTRSIIEQMPHDIRYFHQPNAGPASARNRAIKDASGEFIAFLDADDLWPENNLRLLVAEMISDPAAEVVRGYAQLFRHIGNGKVEYLGNPKDSFSDYIGAGLYRRSVFQKTGLFDPVLKFGEDTDWFNRAREMKVNIKRLDMVTLLVRRHGKNMTEGKTMLELNALKVFKKALDRSRAGSEK